VAAAALSRLPWHHNCLIVFTRHGWRDKIRRTVRILGYPRTLWNIREDLRLSARLSSSPVRLTAEKGTTLSDESADGIEAAHPSTACVHPSTPRRASIKRKLLLDSFATSSAVLCISLLFLAAARNLIISKDKRKSKGPAEPWLMHTV
jgi:hypothetical protein